MSRRTLTIARDLRHALRGLLRNRRTSLLTVALLTLGIGLPTAMFGIVDGVALRGLPVPDGDRIVRVTTHRGYDAPMPAEDFQALRDQQSLFAGVAAYRPSLNSVVTSPGSGSKGLPATFVTGDLFQFLGVEPLLGRNFTLEDEDPAAPAVAIVSHGVWQAQFGGDEGAIGQTVVINREPMTLVGVMPPGFRFPTQEKAWSVLHWRGRPWSQGPVFAVARLRPGMDSDEARTQLALLVERWDEARPLQEARQLHVLPFVETYLSPEILRALDLLLWAVLAILIVASVNAASLRLGDSLSRDGEFYVRRALGARGGDLLRLLLAEAVVLIVVSCTMGIVLAWLLLRWTSRALIATSPVAHMFWVEPRLDLRSCLFAIFLAAVSVLVGGLAPSLWSMRRAGTPSGSRSTLAPGLIRLTGGLVAAQVAISFVLLATSGVLVQSGFQLLARQPAFETEQLTRTMVTTYQADLQTAKEQRAFWEPLFERLGNHPDISGVTLTTGVPWGESPGIRRVPLTVGGSEAGFPPPDRAELVFVLPGFFDTLGLPLLSGRTFDQADIEAADSEDATELPVIVSRSFAERHFGSSSPLGRTFRFYFSTREPMPIPSQVVGVVADRGSSRGDRAGSEEVIYGPLSVADHGGGFLIVRGRGATEGLIRVIDENIAALNPKVATLEARTYDEDRAESLWVERRLAELFSVFAVTVLTLAFGGLFAVVLLALERRRKELAIRTVLGASPASLRRLMLSAGGSPVILGLALGLVLTLLANPLVERFLVDASLLTPGLLIATAVALFAVLSPAILGPARRASRTSPAEILATE